MYRIRQQSLALLILLAALLAALPVSAAPFARPEALSGAWFDPALQGEGYFVLVADAGTVVTYYGYDRLGARLWLVTDAYQGAWAPATAVTLTAFQGAGGVFALPQTGIESWGTLTLRFDSCNAAEITLAGRDGSKLAHAVRLAGVEGQTPCAGAPANADYLAFANPERVSIRGYSEDAMEPFISRDGRYLLFNNSNAPGVDTDLFYAERVDDLTYDLRGRVGGVNTPVLDAVPSLDRDGNFYFISTVFYAQTLSTLFRGRFVNGSVSDVSLLSGLSELVPGHLNFDAEINASGDTLYFVDGVFTGGTFPAAADLTIAERNASGFTRAADSSVQMAALNSADLEYAPCISKNGLELFFTRYSQGQFQIYRSTRWRLGAAFEPAQRIAAIEGFVEAPALSPDERSLYYHRKIGEHYQVYRVTR